MEKNKAEGRSAGIGLGIGESIRRGVAKRKGDKLSVLYDAAVILTAFLFSRCHVALGAYPLALSFIAALPRGVWLALLGAAVGSLSLGKIGVINAVISVVVILLRIIISGGERGGAGLFSEPLVLRIAAATVGSFIGAIYEVLLSGLSVTSVLYGSAWVLLAALFTFLLAGIFYTGVSVCDVLTAEGSIFRAKEKGEPRLIVFQASIIFYIFLLSYSLVGYNFFGISPGYVFSAVITILTAKRFGAIRGMAVGFASALPISGTYSVAFALVGVGAGVLFPMGALYALIAGGILLSAFSAYVGGALGFLTTFPEYTVSALLCAPIIKKLELAKEDAAAKPAPVSVAEDMVNALALSYRAGKDNSEALACSLSAAARILHKVGEAEARLTVREYRDVVIAAEANFCKGCPSYATCVAETPAPCVEFADIIATKLYKKERLFANDPTASPRYCHATEELFSAISRAAADAERERERNRRIVAVADEYLLISRMITEMSHRDKRESATNTALTERLSEMISHVGLPSSAALVLGEERAHFIVAGEDRDGSVITSPELQRGIEEAAGVRLGEREYYRRGDIALLECSADEKYSVEFFAVGKGKTGESVSGDAVASLVGEDGHFSALIADGMGSGEDAHAASQLASELLLELLRAGTRRQTALHVTNHLMKSRCIECSTTVDLFDFDLVTGEAVFYKCGAAASYVKRESSIFRIKSETAPIGVTGAIDAERIRVEVEAGDLVIMLSDGISGGIEDGAWLPKLLAKPSLAGVREYAEAILAEAERVSPFTDDVTVAVARIVKKSA